MRKGLKGLFSVCLVLGILLFSISFLSAGWFSDFFSKFGGETNLSPGDNLELHIDFDGDVADEKGLNSITNNGVTILNDAQRGQVGSFDGSNSYVDLGMSSFGMEGTNELTVALWFKTTSYGTLIRKGHYVKPFSISIKSNDVVETVVRTDTAKTNYLSTISKFSDGAWHHVSFTYDGGDDIRNVYVDGELEESNNVVGEFSISAENTYLGRIPEAESYFQGLMDDVYIYNRALSVSEIQELYGGVTPPPVCDDTCQSLNYECGTQSVCSQNVNCGTCNSGETCSNGNCILETTPPPVGSLHYIRDGATGGDGSSWSSAWDDLPEDLVRGHIYYIADGSYGAYTFDDAESGTQYITVKKAIPSDHGDDAGWSDSWGDGVAEFSVSGGNLLTFLTGYYNIDGQVGGGPGSWDSGHGFRLKGGANTDLIRIGKTQQNPPYKQPSHLRFSHINAGGTQSARVYHTMYQWGGGKGLGSEDVEFKYNFFHDTSRAVLFAMMGDDWLFEYNYIRGSRSTTEHHGTTFADRGTDNVVIRYNLWADAQGTAYVDIKKNEDQQHDNWEIYGNIFFVTDGNPYDSWVGGNGVIGMTSTDSGQSNNFKVYNNDFINLIGLNVGVYFPIGSGNDVYNNLWYTCRRSDGRGSATVTHVNVNHDFNTYYDCDFTSQAGDPGANEIFDSGTPDLFENWQGKDFSLKVNTVPGRNLGAPYNIDMFGNERTTWTRGAIEFNGQAPDPVCGNGRIETGEECDDGNTVSGDGCSATCMIEGSGPICGNNIIEPDEVCEAGDLNMETCLTQGFDSGDLACASNCESFDTSGCTIIPECDLTSASWSASSVVEGTRVTLNVDSVNCDGEEVEFEVWEKDTVVNDGVNVPPQSPMIISGGQAQTTWIAERQCDLQVPILGNCLGDNPEYYFTASVGGESKTSGRLDVSEREVLEGRPYIQDNTLVSADGERLRGATFWLYGGRNWQDKIVWSQSDEAWDALRENGFNSIRLACGYRPWDPNYPLTLDDFETYLDWHVARAEQEGVYVIIDYHDKPGTYQMNNARDFWNRFAPRYADEPHVIYELTNEPVGWEPADYTAQNLDDFEELWNIADANAPDTPSIILTFAKLDSGVTTTPLEVVDSLEGIDWSKTLVGFHSYWADSSERAIELMDNGYAVFNTEFMVPGKNGMRAMDNYDYHGTLMETLGISWLQWDILSRESELGDFDLVVEDLRANNVYWAEGEICGNGFCRGDEDCNTCVQDCGECLPELPEEKLLISFDGDVADEKGLNSITNNGVTILNDAQRGQVGSFDGATNYLSIDNSQVFDVNSISVAFWIKADDVSSKTQALVARGEDWVSDKAQWVVELNDHVNRNKVQLWMEAANDADYYFGSQTAMVVGEWHHFVVTYNAMTKESNIYVDGVLDSSKILNLEQVDVVTPITIGARRNSPKIIQDYFDGAIDDLRIYDVELSAEEVGILEGL